MMFRLMVFPSPSLDAHAFAQRPAHDIALDPVVLAVGVDAGKDLLVVAFQRDPVADDEIEVAVDVDAGAGIGEKVALGRARPADHRVNRRAHADALPGGSSDGPGAGDAGADAVAEDEGAFGPRPRRVNLVEVAADEVALARRGPADAVERGSEVAGGDAALVGQGLGPGHVCPDLVPDDGVEVGPLVADVDARPVVAAGEVALDEVAPANQAVICPLLERIQGRR